MARRYRPVLRDQPFLLPPDMREWLGPDHPVWLVIRVVEEHLDTSGFHAGRRAGGKGTAGYDPDMLVTVLVWAYAHGVTSSRQIRRLCRTDVAFRVICGGSTPGHVTISQFRAGFPQLAGEFFGEVLILCARLGMGQLGVVTLDGTKIAANASRSANRTEGTLRKLAAQTAAAHAETDAAEDALFGAEQAGDQVPEAAWRPGRRDERIAAALASLEADRAAAAAEQAAAQASAVAAAAAGTPRGGRRPGGAAVELAELKLARVREQRAAQLAELEAAGRPRRGKAAGIEDYCRVRQARAQLEQAQAAAAAASSDNDDDDDAGRGGGNGTGSDNASGSASTGKGKGKGKGKKARVPVRNITDPDSRLMPVRGGGWQQCYNPQSMVSKDKLIIATELTSDPADTAWLEPMMRAAEDAAALITARRPPPPPGTPPPPPPAPGTSLIALLLADCGYCSARNLTIPGPDRLIATGKTRDLEQAARDGTPAPARSQPIAAMAARLATSEGITAYRQRGHIAETPHGHIKHNMGFRQLSMRGKPKAAAEWDFTTGVHNLFKAITTGHLTHAALDHLDRLTTQPA